MLGLKWHILAQMFLLHQEFRVLLCSLQLQWDPDNSNQTSFPLDMRHSNTAILAPISRTLDNSKLPQTTFGLPWEKLSDSSETLLTTLIHADRFMLNYLNSRLEANKHFRTGCILLFFKYYTASDKSAICYWKYNVAIAQSNIQLYLLVIKQLSN